MSPVNELVVSLQQLGRQMSDLYLKKHKTCFLLWWWEWRRGCSCPGHVLPEFVGVKGAWASAGPDAATAQKRVAFLTLFKEDHYKSEQTTCWFMLWSHTLTQRYFKIYTYAFCTCICYMLIKTAFLKGWGRLIREKLKVLLDSSGRQKGWARSWRRTHQPHKGNFGWEDLSNRGGFKRPHGIWEEEPAWNTGRSQRAHSLLSTGPHLISHPALPHWRNQKPG